MELEKIWANTLTDSTSLPREDFSLAYYAPILHLATRQSAGDFANLSDTESAVVADWIRSQSTPIPVAQGPATRWLRDGLDWLVQVRGVSGLSEAVVALAFSEVAAYIDPHNCSRRTQTQELVADAISRKQPRVLIAHSLGSVVAYEALLARADLRVELLLTLGSPLALPAIFNTLLNSTGDARLQKPPGVGRWVNFADEGDLIAIPKDLNRYFDGIESGPAITIGKIAFHGIKEYLACPQVAQVIAAYI